jgi:hypothetical protein
MSTFGQSPGCVFEDNAKLIPAKSATSTTTSNVYPTYNTLVLLLLPFINFIII